MRELFDFKGRASRLTYWRVFLLSSVLGAAVFIAASTAIIHLGPWGAVLFLGMLPPLAFSVATGVRRAHDRGRSGVWFWIFSLGPFAIQVAAANLPQAGAGGVLATLGLYLIALILSFWGLVDLGFLRGTPGANAYGNPPPIR